MHPDPVALFGGEIAVWNLAFLVAIFVGYGVLRLARPPGANECELSWLPLRFLVTVYASALGAQLFAYAFDLNTSLLPPSDVSWARYYLDPLYGPKTLYGAMIVLPLTMLLVVQPWSWARYLTMLDRWTPAMMATLAVTRVGCFLQGCCYGGRHDVLGIVFPLRSPVYWRQIQDHVISAGSLPLPVVPAQLLEAIALTALALWSLAAVRRRVPDVFAHGVALYSLVRLALEVVRDDPERNGFGVLSTSQWIALGILAMYGGWRLALALSKRAGLSPSPR